MIKKRKTRIIKVGDVKIGGKNPIAVQSMAKTDTRDVKKTIAQKKLHSISPTSFRVTVRYLEFITTFFHKFYTTLGSAFASHHGVPRCR